MTSWQSLLYCAAADVTLDRIENLVALTGTEPLTVDFKEGGRTATIAECAAAMANAQGGLIFVGITDQGRDIVGVPRETIAHVADVLATHLESPNWTPENRPRKRDQQDPVEQRFSSSHGLRRGATGRRSF
jgi:hypothetical protein